MWLYGFARVVLGTGYRLIYRIRAEGQEHIPRSGGVILCGNHVNAQDPIMIGLASPRPVCFMAKEELFKPPVFGPLIRSLNAFPIRRGDGDAGAIRQAVRALEEGRALIVFPEGTRGDGEHLGDIQAGLIMLAKRSNA